MYLKKQQASQGRLRLRIMEKFTINGVPSEKTLFNIGYIDENDIQALQSWKYFVEVMNEIEKRKDEFKEEEKIKLTLMFLMIRSV